MSEKIVIQDGLESRIIGERKWRYNKESKLIHGTPLHTYGIITVKSPHIINVC
jgi:hypothetical protein